MSASALTKVCNRLLVPYPARGHWAKARSGKALARLPLPPAPEHQARRVTISAERAASRRTQTRLPPEQRREQLIGVAKEIILAQGLHAASMKRIAAQAGISETQAYHYFAGREKLFIALAISENAKIQAAQRADIAQLKDHYAQIIASTRTYLRQIDRRSDLLQLLLRSPDVRSGLREETRRQRKIDRNAHAQRLVNRYGIPRDVAIGCTVILARLCARAAKVISDRKIPLESAERLCLALVVRGSRSVIGTYRNAARGSQSTDAA